MRNLIVLALLTFFSGCSLLSGTKPDVSIVDVQFSDVTLFETTADFVVRITNENPEELIISGASHDIYLNDIHIGKGLSDKKLNIPRLGSATQEVKVHISNLSLISHIQSLIDAKNFDYRIESTIYLDDALGLSRYHVNESGHFEKPNL